MGALHPNHTLIDIARYHLSRGVVWFQVRRVGNWKSTILGGEGLVCELTGPGRVLMQSRSEEAFLGWLLPKIPQKSN